VYVRTETEVQDRIRYLLTQELGRRIAESQARQPRQCKHNLVHPLDVRKRVGGSDNPQYNRIQGGSLPLIGLCMLGSDDPTTWPGKICEEAADAVNSEFFEPRLTSVEVQAEFEAQVQDLSWVHANMPEVYGLLWALGSDKAPKLPWWKLWWFRFLQIRPDALRAAALSPGG
jgi:hypothetical protein